MGTVDDYLATIDEPARSNMEHMYAIARAAVPDTEQGSGYGMPALTYRGKSLLAVMRAKAHIGLYPFSGKAIAAIADLLVDVDYSAGAIRVPLDAVLPDATVRALVEARRAQIDGH